MSKLLTILFFLCFSFCESKEISSSVRHELIKLHNEIFELSEYARAQILVESRRDELKENHQFEKLQEIYIAKINAYHECMQLIEEHIK